ncbi:MAG: hypothetical protein EBS05_04665 [Proteobacteria bacterium]|nr:hypothetical protein [Pseudomonadota bacterium]
MKLFDRTLTAFAFHALITSIWLAATPAQAVHIGTAQVKKVVGTVSYADAGGSGPIKEGDVFRQGTTITTGAGSFVDLDLGVNGDALRVEADSTLALNQLNYVKAGQPVMNTGLEVTKGTVVANVIHKLSSASRYEIKTPAGVAGIRGTVLQAGTAQIMCLVGTVEFRPTAGGGVQLVIGGTVYSGANNTVTKATTVQTSGLAKSATACTQSVAPASVTAVVQQFTAAIAAQAAAEIGKAGGDVSKTASAVAKDIMTQLVAQVQAAAQALPDGQAKTDALKQVATLTANVEILQATAAATAAAAATVANGGNAAAAKTAASQAAQQSTPNKTISNAVTANVDTAINNSTPPGGKPNATVIVDTAKDPTATASQNATATPVPTTTTTTTTPPPNSTAFDDLAKKNSNK